MVSATETPIRNLTLYRSRETFFWIIICPSSAAIELKGPVSPHSFAEEEEPSIYLTGQPALSLLDWAAEY